jgi:signal transduction histidine kinase
VAESVDLNEATSEVITLLRSAMQRNLIQLRLDLAETLPLVNGDRVQLQQVILNLLTNASEAMTNVEDRPRELLVSTQVEQPDLVRVTVRDNGVGISPQDADKIFTAFYTTKHGGMGVGLSVSRSIIEGHRGRLWASANDGPGTTFSFCIPYGQDGTGPRLHYFADSVRRPV